MAKHIYQRYSVAIRQMVKLLDNHNYCIQSSVSISSTSTCSSSSTSSTTTNANQEIASPSRCPFSRMASSLSSSFSTPSSTMQPAIKPLSSLKPYDSIPSPKGLFLFGTIFDLIKAGGAEYVHKYCDSRHKQLGPIYKEKMGNQEIVFISDAELIQKVYQFEGKYPQHMVPEPWIIFNEIKGVQRGLFFMDGPEWCQRRKGLNKLLLMPATINRYIDVFNQVIDDLIRGWNNTLACSDNSDGDQNILEHLEKDLYNWSIESLGTMIFGRRLGCVKQFNNNTEFNMNTSNTNLNDDNNEKQIHNFVHWVQQIFIESANMTMIPPRIAYALNLPVWKRFVQAAENALSLARSYVEENFQEIKNEHENNQNLKKGIINEMFNENHQIDQEEIVRIITDLFIAAADTTSHATQWALYLLAKNPSCQEKLLEEVNGVTGGAQVEECHLSRLPYVKGVIKEALRLYPVAPFLTRYLSRDLDLGGYHIPSGKLIAMSLYTTGREEQYFASSNDFNPERWIRDQNTGKNQITHSHACLPFGIGVRSCIGRRVAEIQMQFLLTRIVQTFSLSPASSNEIGIKLRMITTPEQPIRLLIKNRRQNIKI